MPFMFATDEQLEQLRQAELVVLDFYASWCGPCKIFAPIFESVAARFPEIPFVKVDIDKAKMLAKAARVRSVPTIVILKRGNVVFSKSAVLSRDQLANAVLEHSGR